MCGNETDLRKRPVGKFALRASALETRLTSINGKRKALETSLQSSPLHSIVLSALHFNGSGTCLQTYPVIGFPHAKLPQKVYVVSNSITQAVTVGWNAIQHLRTRLADVLGKASHVLLLSLVLDSRLFYCGSHLLKDDRPHS
ncbi:hypothetical protein P5673_020856 [Acropora cervicornis]|uniref:Uncharacterized protein n=1 Tax=Acropora cervicornis TaxID=6130 RepID=A0AAD9Q941_ACRCE|nr:hypothetical protein P5673_020856 [Acropora cervicornis]